MYYYIIFLKSVLTGAHTHRHNCTKRSLILYFVWKFFPMAKWMEIFRFAESVLLSAFLSCSSPSSLSLTLFLPLFICLMQWTEWLIDHIQHIHTFYFHYIYLFIIYSWCIRICLFYGWWRSMIDVVALTHFHFYICTSACIYTLLWRCRWRWSLLLLLFVDGDNVVRCAATNIRNIRYSSSSPALIIIITIIIRVCARTYIYIYKIQNDCHLHRGNKNNVECNSYVEKHDRLFFFLNNRKW